MTTARELRRLQEAAKLIEIEGTGGYRSTVERFGETTATTLLVALLRREHGSEGTFPPRPEIDGEVMERLRSMGILKEEGLPRADDLSQFTPGGEGLYGFSPQTIPSPFLGAPATAAHGGVVYFDNDITRQDFEAMMRALGVTRRGDKPIRDFGHFHAESKNPGKEGYLTQVRTVSRFGLQYLFRSLNEKAYESFPLQDLDLVTSFWLFIEAEKQRWGTFFGDSPELAGKFGGDGNYSREELCFGFMVENDYYRVYRIWSRAQLVTK